jgi:hypothetical protein
VALEKSLVNITFSDLALPAERHHDCNQYQRQGRIDLVFDIRIHFIIENVIIQPKLFHLGKGKYFTRNSEKNFRYINKSVRLLLVEALIAIFSASCFASNLPASLAV